MSYACMIVIAALYGGSAIGFLLEGRWRWAAVATCWGIGNALLAEASR